jgi:hypothetical protein
MWYGSGTQQQTLSCKIRGSKFNIQPLAAPPFKVYLHLLIVVFKSSSEEIKYPAKEDAKL